MGEDMCMDCRGWEEEIYWTYFQCTQFYQALNPGFDLQLPVPTTFSNNLKKQLPEIVTLKGPSGSAWEVGLTTIDGTLFFRHGWEKFVKDHLLQKGDLLIFKYNGDSQFDVLVFDGQSRCEKAASYFVRKCGHGEHDGGYQTKRKIGETSVEVAPTPSQDDDGDTPPEKSANNHVSTTSLRHPIIAQAASNKARRKIEFSLDHLKPSARKEEPTECAEEIEIKSDVERTLISSNLMPGVLHVSSRRLVTEKEKHNTLQLASASLTDEGFLVVMRPTHVYRKFYMVIPSGWMTRHLRTRAKQDMILRIEDKKWKIRFLYHRSKNSGGLSSGWRNFAVDNKLEEFDVCVFEPGSPINNSVVLDVNIFRVVS